MITLNDLQKFCGINDVRTYLNKPMKVEGFVYALNGHIAVRVIDDGSFDIPESSPKILNFSRIFTKMALSELKPLSELMVYAPQNQLCLACSGLGKKITAHECDECDGNGQFEYGSHTYECAECNGSGRHSNECISMTCKSCTGTGLQNVTIQVGNQKYGLNLIDLIKSLPNVKIECETENHEPAYFTFDGGDGVLMAIRC